MRRRGVALLALLAAAACGHEPEAHIAELRRRAAAWPETERVGALLDADGRRVCSATVLGPDQLVTSARCATLAAAQRMRFVAGPPGVALDASVEARAVAAAAVGPNPPLAEVRRRGAAALAALVLRCQIDDPLDLQLSARERRCALSSLPPSALVAAGWVGLARWGDVATVTLDRPLATSGAPPAPVLAPATDLGAVGPGLWVLGTRHPARRAGPQRTFSAWVEVATADGEIHARALAGRPTVDVGAGLWRETVRNGLPAIALVAVASRPFVVHGDGSAGMIFARLPEP